MDTLFTTIHVVETINQCLWLPVMLIAGNVLYFKVRTAATCILLAGVWATVIGYLMNGFFSIDYEILHQLRYFLEKTGFVSVVWVGSKILLEFGSLISVAGLMLFVVDLGRHLPISRDAL